MKTFGGQYGRLIAMLILLCAIYIAPHAVRVLAQTQNTNAPKITNVSVSDVKQDSATINWKTDEDADSLVNYGQLDNYGIVRDPLPDHKDHQIVLDQLEPSRTYHFRVVSVDANGNQSISGDYKFTTPGVQNIQNIQSVPTKAEQAIVQQIVAQLQKLTTEQAAKVVKQQLQNTIQGITKDLTIVGPPKVEAFTDHAIITWTTDRGSNSTVSFVPEADYDPLAADPYAFTQSSSDQEVKEHQVDVIGLEPYTKYHFQVSSTDNLGVTGKSGDFTFTTKAVLPNILNLRTVKVEEDAATLAWNTTVPASSIVEYEDLDTGEKRSIGDPSLITDHQLRLPDLTLGTQYRAIVVAQNAGGDQVRSDPITFVTVQDKTPPIISNVTNESTLFPGDASRIQTIVSWQTDEPAICQFNYHEGLASGVKAVTLQPNDNNPTQKHVQVVVAFNPATVYKYWITCTDTHGNSDKTEDFVLFTPSQQKSIIDIIIQNFESSFGWVKNLGL